MAGNHHESESVPLGRMSRGVPRPRTSNRYWYTSHVRECTGENLSADAQERERRIRSVQAAGNHAVLGAVNQVVGTQKLLIRAAHHKRPW